MVPQSRRLWPSNHDEDDTTCLPVRLLFPHSLFVQMGFSHRSLHPEISAPWSEVKNSMRSSFILVPIFAQAKTYFNNFVWISKFWKVVHALKALTKFWDLGTMAKDKVAQKWSFRTKKRPNMAICHLVSNQKWS